MIGDHRDHNKCNLDTSILYSYRDSDFQDLRHHTRIRAEIFSCKMDSGFSVANEYQGNDHTESLGKCGSKGCSGWSHMEKANENVIQYNIGSTGNGHKLHGSFGITNATEYGADYVISWNKGNSDKTDDKILCGTCHRFCRDTDQYNNGPDEEKKQERKKNGNSHE